MKKEVHKISPFETMKPGERSKLMRNLRQESRRFRLLVFVIGFFLVTLTFIVVTKPDAILFSDG